jgi:hypothetical protein
MKHDLSLRGEIFNDAVELFDLKLHDVLNTLLRQGLTDGSVTLKLNVELWTVGEQDEDGVYHDTNKTHFDYNVSSAVTQKSKSNGEVADMLKLRVVDGQLELRDLDENTIFDLVEGEKE